VESSNFTTTRPFICLTYLVDTRIFLLVTLKTARLRAKLTQAQLANLSKVDQRTISAIENGKIYEPSHVKVVRICRALGVDPQSIDEFRVNEGSGK
jgi:transcriptional regulator with XRE-family HTH domain